MQKEIPVFFESIIIDSPTQNISTPDLKINHLKVRVFTKYANRNGSYITEEVANQLITSAITGITPVIGFFDPETKTWASHTGPTLANAYGYVENFIGWEPFTDSDGISRDYAVFSIVLFSDYFEETQMIVGQNQSMELDVNSINGAWAEINGQEYFVYTTAKMLGFCIIGNHEPCFSGSAFFSKENNQYEQFSALLADLRSKVEKLTEGGEIPMDNENNQVVVETPEENITEFEEKVTEEEVTEQIEEVSVEETVEEPTEEPIAPEVDTLQQQFNEQQQLYEDLQANYNLAVSKIEEFEKTQSALQEQINNLTTQNQELQNQLKNYEEQNALIELERKDSLIKNYEKVLKEEEIAVVREQIKNYTYEELESKLAIAFANQQLTSVKNEDKVPLPEPQESRFALLMKKYRKN